MTDKLQVIKGEAVDWIGVNYFHSTSSTAKGHSPGLQVFAASGSGDGAYMSFHRAGVYAVNMGLDADNIFRIGGWSASPNCLQLNMTGNLTTAGDVSTLSDERLKVNIEPITDAGQRVAALRGVNFTSVTNHERSTGVIAQEVRKVLPEAVAEDEDGVLSVKYGNMVGLLIEAIKELQVDVAKLKMPPASAPDDVASQVLHVPEEHAFYFGTSWAWEGLGVGVVLGAILSVFNFVFAYFGLGMTTLEDVNALFMVVGIVVFTCGVVGALIGRGMMKETAKRHAAHR